MASITRVRQRFGGLLRELRTRAGRSADDAAAELRVKPNVVIRYETGEVQPPWGTVRALLSYYGATAEQVAEAGRRWEEVCEEPRSVQLPSGAPRAFRKLVNAERERVRERDLSPFVVPGLLQTEPYARALIGAGHRFLDPKAKPDSVIAARLKRQQRLTDADSITLHALIDEAVLHRRIGGTAVLRDQLTHLLRAGERPNITIQVIPFTAGGYGTMNGSCIIVDYPEPSATPGIYLEYPAGGAWVDNKRDVDHFTTMFDEAIELAHTPIATADLIRDTINALDREETVIE